MEKKKIQCPKCHGLSEVTNPQAEPVLMITCPNPQCGARLRVTFDTGDTVLAATGDKSSGPGGLRLGGNSYPLAEGENTVGRASKSSTATVQLPTDDMAMSRQHLRIVVTKLKSGRTKVMASDMRDAAKTVQLPTLIDDEPLLPEDIVVLANGDVLTLGKTQVKYEKQ